MLAIIKTGGKQYVVSPGDKIKIEKLKDKEGKKVVFSHVLLIVDDKNKTEIGSPFVKGAKVEAKVLEQGKAKKVIVFKYRAKKRRQTKKGHRQPYSQVEILEIVKKSSSAKKSVS